jgi:hypothetical protein
MINMFKLCQFIFITFALAVPFKITKAIAQESLLGGKVFVGQYREHHKSPLKDDQLSFLDGAFHSIGYGQRGFLKGLYTAREEKSKIYFEAETVNPKQGKIKWRGVIHGDAIDVDYIWNKEGWLSDTEKKYSFKGILKK